MAARNLTPKPTDTYKNRHVVEDGIHVIRYMALAQLGRILVDKTLCLTRVDRFKDKFEGSVPKQHYDGQQPLFSGGQSMFSLDWGNLSPDLRRLWQEDPYTRTKRWRRALKRSAHASCWRYGSESEGMWRLYCGEREGVALQTTFGRLEASVETANLLVGCIQYRNYLTGDRFDHELDPLMSKRDGFETEQEVRLLHIDLEHYRKLQASDAGVADLVESFPVPWSINGVIEKILVSPYADAMYLEAVQAAVDKWNPNGGPSVEHSELWGEPWL
jgi:hypothetical protein